MLFGIERIDATDRDLERWTSLREIFDPDLTCPRGEFAGWHKGCGLSWGRGQWLRAANQLESMLQPAGEPFPIRSGRGRRNYFQACILKLVLVRKKIVLEKLEKSQDSSSCEGAKQNRELITSFRYSSAVDQCTNQTWNEN
jgi:hypothetical protein